LTDNVYKPPQSNLLQDSDTDTRKFYVVSKTKLSVLFLTTFGIYVVYWFYVNWRNYKDATGQKLRPILRAIFYIFFTHSLFKKVDSELSLKELEFNWSPSIVATLFVFISIARDIFSSFSSNGIDSPLTDILSLVILPIALPFLLKAQDAINISQNDMKGESNCKFTVYNYLWIFVGALLWLSAAINLMGILGLISL